MDLIIGAILSIYVSIVFGRYQLFVNIKQKVRGLSRRMWTAPQTRPIVQGQPREPHTMYISRQPEWAEDIHSCTSDLLYYGHTKAGYSTLEIRSKMINVVSSKAYGLDVHAEVQTMANSLTPSWITILFMKITKEDMIIIKSWMQVWILTTMFLFLALLPFFNVAIIIIGTVFLFILEYKEDVKHNIELSNKNKSRKGIYDQHQTAVNARLTNILPIIWDMGPENRIFDILTSVDTNITNTKILHLAYRGIRLSLIGIMFAMFTSTFMTNVQQGMSSVRIIGYIQHCIKSY